MYDLSFLYILELRELQSSRAICKNYMGIS